MRVRLEGVRGPDDVRRAITQVENKHGRNPDTIQVSPQSGMSDCKFCGIDLTVMGTKND